MPEEEIEFTVEARERGYAHVRIQGTYKGPATLEGVKKLESMSGHETA